MVGWEDVLEFLSEAAPRDVNAWQISQRFRISQNAARVALYRLSQRVPPVAYRTKRGFYTTTASLVSKTTPYDDFLRFGFHGIEAVANCNELAGEGSRRLRLILTSRFLSPSHRRNPANRSIVYDAEWHGRPQTIQLTTKGKLQVSLRASAAPLDLLEFHAYLATLLHTFDIPAPLWRLSFDLNDDREGRLRMADLSWNRAIGFVRIYWKRALERTRVEARDHRGVSLETLLPAVERVLDALLELEAL